METRSNSQFCFVAIVDGRERFVSTMDVFMGHVVRDPANPVQFFTNPSVGKSRDGVFVLHDLDPKPRRKRHHFGRGGKWVGGGF